jgi:hypothetical protein
MQLPCCDASLLPYRMITPLLRATGPNCRWRFPGGPCQPGDYYRGLTNGPAAYVRFGTVRGQIYQLVVGGGDTKKRRAPKTSEGPSASVLIDRYHEQDATALCSYGHFLPKRSNSPFRAPPRKACHSSDVNRRTGPSGSLLLRTPIPPSGRLATSTQLPLEKLRELLTQ